MSKTKVPFKGSRLLEDPFYNKGTAFTRDERRELNLECLLPYQVFSLEKQIERAWIQYNSFDDNLLKNEFLLSMRDQNIVLFFAILQKYTEEVFPIIYTPTEGEFIAQYSTLFRRPSGGCFLSYPDNTLHLIDTYLGSFGSREDIDLIVCSDGEQILGIGDQGVGGIGISQAKLIIYTLAAGINPSRVLPVVLDVGTNNERLLKDELYVGWKHPRIQGKEYDDFIDTFVKSVKRHFPDALLHFEDFGLLNARRLLEKYRPNHTVFNDDIQGTGAVTLAAIMAAISIKKSHLQDQKIIIYGAGTAGTGIADQLRDAMMIIGNNTQKNVKPLTKEQAINRIYCIDKQGLCMSSSNLSPAQIQYAKSKKEISKWDIQDINKGISLLDVIKNVHPTILIGTSTHTNAFTKEIIEEMCKYTSRPIILPLSNPTSLCEIRPIDAYEWSKGEVLIATGSPFPIVEYEGKKYKIAECNNAMVYPGIGLGVIVSKSRLLSDTMIFSAVKALAELSPALNINDPDEMSLLPNVTQLRQISIHIAAAVAKRAIDENLALNTHIVNMSMKEIESYLINEICWNPVYKEFYYES